MELRSCGTTHFIQTIKSGFVQKVCNTSSPGRPVTRSKIVKDVYESEDAKGLQTPPSGLVFDHEQVKDEGPCLLVADRTLREVKPETHEFARHADDDMGDGMDDDTTLKQLKKWLLTKKRKSLPVDENLKQDNANEKAAQDESDLNEPIINWKSKHSKSSKAKRRRLKIHSSSTIDVTIKSEENLVSECSPKAGLEPAPVNHVKVEVPDAEQLGCQNVTSSGDASSIGHNELSNPGPNMVLNGYSREPPLCVTIYENCVTNEISYDHLDGVEPTSVLVPGDGMSVKLETPETASREPLDFPSVESEKQTAIQDSHPWRQSLSKDPNPDLCSHSRSSSIVEDMPDMQVPDTAVDGCMGLHQERNFVPYEDKIEGNFPCEPNNSLRSPDKNCGSDLDSITPSNTKQNLIFVADTSADKEQPFKCSLDAMRRNDLNCEGHIEDDLLKAVDKQNPAVATTGAQNESSVENSTCDSADTILILEPNQPPERLLSMRKAVSSTSEEQLQLAISSAEILNDSNQNMVLECKEKLFENKTTEKLSSPGSDIQHDITPANHRQPEKDSQQQVVITPRRIIRRLHTAKGNIEGPRPSRSLSNVTTGCNSIQGCTASAIAFSQRQMRDMESLASKLMNELKSMKDIVEQKLLFEAYRNVSVKNDADEVKLAINNATKVEELGKRWMSMIARDCTRFCKIMKMTPDSPSPSKDTSSREKRKIMFADEAGGELCHVKYFDYGASPPVADAVEQ